MKIEDVTLDMMKDFCGISDDSSDDVLRICMSASKAYIMSRTALSESEINSYDELTIAFHILCNEFYSKRDYSFTNMAQIATNKCIDTILDMHSKNHLY